MRYLRGKQKPFLNVSEITFWLGILRDHTIFIHDNLGPSEKGMIRAHIALLSNLERLLTACEIENNGVPLIPNHMIREEPPSYSVPGPFKILPVLRGLPERLSFIVFALPWGVFSFR